MDSKVWLSKINGDLELAIASAFEWMNGGGENFRGTRVTIKPNLTYPFYKKGVTTNPKLLEALVRFLKNFTPNISVVESDGGSYSWPAEEAFRGHEIDNMSQQYGVKVLNLTRLPREWVETDIDGRCVRLEMSSHLLHETDVFITMPVPKVHAMTKVSLGFKNQWGCLPDVKRLRNHSEFPHKVLAINKILKPKFAIFDGTYFLNGNGPMEGDPVKMELLVASNDVGAGSLACCKLMQIEPGSVRHLRLAMKIGMMPNSIEEVEVNDKIQDFVGPPFYLKRTWLQWVVLGFFHSYWATRIAYDSPLAKPLHDILYYFRGRPKDFSPKW